MQKFSSNLNIQSYEIFNSFISYFLFGGSFLVSAQPPLGKPDKDFSTDEKPRPKFPRHWGKPPLFQTKDIVEKAAR